MKPLFYHHQLAHFWTLYKQNHPACALLCPAGFTQRNVWHSFVLLQVTRVHFVSLPHRVPLHEDHHLFTYSAVDGHWDCSQLGISYAMNMFTQVSCNRFIFKSSCGCCFVFFFKFIFEREREHKQGRSRERGRHRIRGLLQALSCQYGAQCGARTHEPRDHDLSQSQMLHGLNHPGGPSFHVVLRTASRKYQQSFVKTQGDRKKTQVAILPARVAVCVWDIHIPKNIYYRAESHFQLGICIFICYTW